MGRIRRREILTAGTGLALAALGGRSAAAARRKRIAILATAYTRNSHADVIAGRLIQGYEYYGRYRKPAVDVVSMYTDQTPEGDLSRGLAAQYGFPIYPTVREALLCGGSTLAVDGVALIGEQGHYPLNEKGQQLYPRYELYKQIIDVFAAAGRSAPVYCDKFFSYDWTKAQWMYEQSHRLRFPLMAGSSVPLAWRHPPLELELGTPVVHAVATAYGAKEAYGFHGLECLQSMVERRKGGETGVAAVQCLDGAAVWEWTGQNPWAERLMNAADARCATLKPGSPRDLVKNPSVFVIEYRSGLRAAVYVLDGLLEGFNFACEIAGQKDPASTEMWLQPGRYFSHFAGLVYCIEQFIVNERAPYPVERTLLTTGMIDAAMNSAYEKGKRLETPELAIRYDAPKESFFNRGPVPPIENPRL